MKKIIFNTFFLGMLFCAKTSIAQVKYNLSLLPDKKTYMVSLVSSKTWNYPQNLTSTAQVTIKVPSNKPFLAGVTSLIPEIQWLDNSYIEKPKSDPSHTFISFGMVSGGTSKLHYKEGEEIPLFTFRNLELDPCVGKISLLDNVKDAFTGKDAETYNISNQISVLATEGDVYEGNLQSETDCSIVSSNVEIFGDSGIQAYPIPAYDQLTIDWQKAEFKTQMDFLMIENAEGQVIARNNIAGDSDKKLMSIDVSHFAPGFYYYYFKGANNFSKKYKFLVVR